MFKNLKPYTKEQRMKLYKKALIDYRKNYEDPVPGFGYWSKKVYGMCESIAEASEQMHREGYARRPINKQYLPEYWAFQPKTCWRQDSSYWFTRYRKNGGYHKRLSLLTALVAGKTPEQWKKEWAVEKKELSKEWKEQVDN